METQEHPGPLPVNCPECGSADTGEKVDGDPDCRECYACEAFWYICNTRTGVWESCPGSVRNQANAEYAAAEDRRLFGPCDW